MTAGSREAADRLSRICGVCALGFLFVIVLVLVLERAGATTEIAGAICVLAPLAAYAGIGLWSRTADWPEYLIAGRAVPAVFAGIAAGAEWTAAAVVLGAAGSLFMAGNGGHALAVGLAGGYLLSAVLIVPFLRNAAAVTLPDFLATRFGGNAVRILGVIALVACAFIFATALIQTAGGIVARSLRLDADVAVYCVVAIVLASVFSGGMRALTATQVAQWMALFLGCVALFLVHEAQGSDAPAASGFGPVLEGLEALLRGLGLASSPSPHSASFRLFEELSSLELTVCLLLGTASMPHVLTRPLTTPGVREARASVAWSLLFIAPLAFALPTFVALSFDNAKTGHSVLLSGLVAAVGMTAMLAAAGGLLLTIANSLGHDIWHRIAAPGAAPEQRLKFARLALIVAGALVAYAAATGPADPHVMVSWAFSFAAAAFFPALVLGIWWKRASTAAAICGIVAGLGLCLFYIVVTRYFPQSGVTQLGMAALVNPATGRPLVNVADVLADVRWLADVPASAANPLASKVGWFDVGNTACGVFGVTAGFLTIFIVSLLSKKPNDTLLDDIRSPAGKPALKS